MSRDSLTVGCKCNSEKNKESEDHYLMLYIEEEASVFILVYFSLVTYGTYSRVCFSVYVQLWILPILSSISIRNSWFEAKESLSLESLKLWKVKIWPRRGLCFSYNSLYITKANLEVRLFVYLLSVHFAKNVRVLILAFTLIRNSDWCPTKLIIKHRCSHCRGTVISRLSINLQLNLQNLIWSPN